MSAAPSRPAPAAGGRHQSPLHCPYCGEDDALFPRQDGWECRGCLRAFAVSYLGQVSRPEVLGAAAPAGAAGRSPR